MKNLQKHYVCNISQRFTAPRMRNVHRSDTHNIFEGLFKTIDFRFHSNLIRKFAEGVAQNGILITQIEYHKILLADVLTGFSCCGPKLTF